MPKKLNTDTFIKKAKQIHGDKYDYSKVEYTSIDAKVCIICPEHGEFWQDPHTHLKGSGCKRCGFREKYNTDSFIEKAKKIHGNKYDYSKAIYKGSHEKVCIICPTHGEFWQSPHTHLKGSGCPFCCKSHKLNIETFINRAKIKHGDKYDYSKVIYKNASSKVCIICPTHGEFWQQPRHHLYGYGCPKCTESSLESDIRLLLELNNIKYMYQCNHNTFKWLGKQSLDFYLPDYKTAIECQGRQHFIPISIFGGEDTLKETESRDSKKLKLCKDNGIKLIYYSNLGIIYPYTVYEDKNKILNIIKNE